MRRPLRFSTKLLFSSSILTPAPQVAARQGDAQRKAPAQTGADRNAIVESSATSSVVAFRYPIFSTANAAKGSEADVVLRSIYVRLRSEADSIGTCLKVLVRLEGAEQGVWQCYPELEASAPRQPVSSGCF